MGRRHGRWLPRGAWKSISATLVDALDRARRSRQRPKQQGREEGTREPSAAPGLECDASSARIQEAVFFPRGLEGGKLLGRWETSRRSSVGPRAPAAGQAGPESPVQRPEPDPKKLRSGTVLKKE